MADNSSIFQAAVSQLFINQTDTFVEVIEMYLDDPELVTLDANELVAVDALQDIPPLTLTQRFTRCRTASSLTWPGSASMR